MEWLICLIFEKSRGSHLWPFTYSDFVRFPVDLGAVAGSQRLTGAPQSNLAGRLRTSEAGVPQSNLKQVAGSQRARRAAERRGDCYLAEESFVIEVYECFLGLRFF